MQMLIIFGPYYRVRNISFSVVHILFIALFFIATLISLNWIWNSVSGEVKKALYSEVNKKTSEGGFPSGSEGAYEAKLMQLQMRLDSFQRKLDRLPIEKPGPPRSTYGALNLVDQAESYGVRLDRMYVDLMALDASLDEVHQVQASPLPLPLQPTGSLGYRIDPFTCQLAWHKGVDFRAAYGTPILATEAGVVMRAAWDKDYGYVVDIQHQNSILTRYAHAQTLLVKQGDLVSKSQAIARVGSTGRSTGPHLHYEVIKNGKRLEKG